MNAITQLLPNCSPSAVEAGRDHGVLMEIDLFILDRSPEAFHKDVVVHAASAIHADAYLLLL